MTIKQTKIGFGFLFLLFFATNCLQKEKDLLINSEPKDTTTAILHTQGLLLDTRSSKGLPDAKVDIFIRMKSDSNVLVSTVQTDSTGYFQSNFRQRKLNGGFIFSFSHANPIFINRTYDGDSHDYVNDSTGLYYLHRKSGCEISLKNKDGKVKNVMLFNQDKHLSKVIMNLRKDTTFTYLLKDYEDIVYFDYLPQKELQSKAVRGSTSGDTIKIQFMY